MQSKERSSVVNRSFANSVVGRKIYIAGLDDSPTNNNNISFVRHSTRSNSHQKEEEIEHQPKGHDEFGIGNTSVV